MKFKVQLKTNKIKIIFVTKLLKQNIIHRVTSNMKKEFTPNKYFLFKFIYKYKVIYISNLAYNSL